MINTNISAYLQNGGIQNSNIGEIQKNESKKIEKPNEKDEVKVIISPKSKAMMKIDDLLKQLENIFGTKKELTADELVKESELKDKIEQINQTAELPYNQAEISAIKDIDSQIQEILEKSYYSYQDDEKLFDLTKQVEHISKKYGPPSLSETNIEKSEELTNELHALQGYNNPDIPELIEAERIYKKIDILTAEFKIAELDINSDTYTTDKKELRDQISTAKESLEQLDTSEIKYEKEEIRETARNAIKNSLATINTAKDNFFNSIKSSDGFTFENPLINENTNDNPKENKWLNFLQDSRKEFHSNSNELESSPNEENRVLKLINRVRTLRE